MYEIGDGVEYDLVKATQCCEIANQLAKAEERNEFVVPKLEALKKMLPYATTSPNSPKQKLSNSNQLFEIG